MNRLQRLGALAGLLGVLSLSGCAGEAEPPEPSPSPDSAAGPSSASPSEAPLPTAEVSAVDGPVMGGEVASVRVPAGFEPEEFGFGIFDARKGRYYISLAEVAGVPGLTLRDMVRAGLTTFDSKPTVSYDAELGGEDAWVAVGRDPGGHPYREYGAVRGDDTVTVGFLFPESTSQADQDAFAESVLATFTWK